MIIDIHLHTERFSPCSHMTVIHLLYQAERVGLDGVVLTDHDHFWPLGELAALRRRFPGLAIFNGAEVTGSNGHHYLVFGIGEKEDITRRIRFSIPVDELVRLVQENGGSIVLAHPYRYDSLPDPAADSAMVDGVEVMSCNTTPPAGEKAWIFAQRFHVTPVAGSDGHETFSIGRYATEFIHPIETEEELALALRKGECFPAERWQESRRIT